MGYPQLENSHINETFKDILVENDLIQGFENQNSVHIPLHKFVLSFFKITQQREKHKRTVPRLITFAQITSCIKSVQKYYLHE